MKNVKIHGHVEKKHSSVHVNQTHFELIHCSSIGFKVGQKI